MPLTCVGCMVIGVLVGKLVVEPGLIVVIILVGFNVGNCVVGYNVPFIFVGCNVLGSLMDVMLVI